MHSELGRRHARPEHAVGGDGVAVERQAAEGAAQIVERQAGVDERTEHHVAGNAGKAVEVQHACH